MFCREPLDNAFCSLLGRAAALPAAQRTVLYVEEERANFRRSSKYPYHIISVLLAGEQQITFYRAGEMQRRILRTGDICFINRNCPYELSWEQDCSRLGCGCGRDWLKMSWNYNARLTGREYVPMPNLWYSAFLDDGGRLYNLYNLASEEFRSCAAGGAGLVLGQYVFLRTRDAVSAQNRPVKQRSGAFEKVKSYVDEYFHTGISRKTIAGYFNLNQDYVTRLFKENAGILLSDYINDLRLKKACTLLYDSDLSIREIARLCGYSCDNYLIRLFKNVYGVAPGEFRRQKRTRR